MRGKNMLSHFLVLYERRREREGESSNFSLRSTEIGWSEFVGQRTKFHLLDEGYA